MSRFVELEVQKDQLRRKALEHEEAARCLSKMHEYLGFPMKLCPFLATTAFAANLAIEGGSGDCIQPINTSAGATTFIGGLFVVLREFMACRRKAQQHEQACMTYCELRRDLMLFGMQEPVSEMHEFVVKMNFQDKLRLADNAAPEVSDCIKKRVAVMLQQESKETQAAESRVRQQRVDIHQPEHNDNRARVLELESMQTDTLREICSLVNQHKPINNLQLMSRSELLDYLALDANKEQQPSNPV
jgi:hypothetical protein